MSAAIQSVLLASALGFGAQAQAPALRAGVSVQLAATTHAIALPAADLPDAQIVAVTAGGKVYVGTTPVPPAELAAKLKAGSPVYVKADARSKYSDVAAALDALRQAGVPAAFLLTAQRDAAEQNYPLPPKGLEIRLAPAAGSLLIEVQVKAGDSATFADVVRAADACRGAGAVVLLARPAPSR